ncbi:MAG: hypothetical protein WBZ48_00665 [Bacteroidota bacterium]
MIRRLYAIVVACVLIVGISKAQDSAEVYQGRLKQNPDDIETLTKLGEIYHNQGVAGDDKAVEKGFTCFNKILELDPSNALGLAYRGSLWTLRARDAWWPFTKMKDVDNGVDEMDKAVDLAPDNISVRLVRGINSIHLPSMFRRLPIALKDFDFMLNDARFAGFNPHLRSIIYYWAGVAFQSDGQRAKAKELLQNAVAADPNSETARKAEDELKKIS